MPIIDALLATPLVEEFKAVLSVMGDHVKPPPKHDGIVYWLWTEGPYQIAGAPVGSMGLAGTAAYIGDALREWSPAHAFLVGIAGGIDPPAKLPLGDVVVPDQIIGYEVASVSGPDQSLTFRPTGNQPGFVLNNRVQAFELSPDMARWQQDCLDSAEGRALRALNRLDAAPKIHFKPIASGNEVVKSKRFGEGLKKALHEKLCAVEMEARGAFQTLYRHGDKTKLLMVRGISDHADEDKEQLDAHTEGLWRAYAVGNAARLVRALLRVAEIPVVTKPIAVQLAHNKSPGAAFHARGLLVDGLQHLHFPAFLSRTDCGTLALRVRIEPRGCGVAITPRHILCVLKSHSGDDLVGPTPKGELVLTASEKDYVADLFLTFATPVDEVRVDVSDAFQTCTSTWGV